jgi:hypothetical protein
MLFKADIKADISKMAMAISIKPYGAGDDCQYSVDDIHGYNTIKNHVYYLESSPDPEYVNVYDKDGNFRESSHISRFKIITKGN